MNRKYFSTYKDRALLLIAVSVGLIVWPVVLWAQTLTSPWVVYTEEDGLASNNVFVVSPSEGEVWFGTDSGISRFDGAWTSWEDNPDFRRGVRSIAVGEAQNELWAGTETGAVFAWGGEVWTEITRLDVAVYALHYSGGELWIGTAEGLYLWNGSGTVPIAELGALQINAIGNQGNSIWVGTTDGLWLRQRNVWSVIQEGDGLPGQEVTALWVDPTGPVWVAADGDIAWRDPANGVWQPVVTEPLHIPERVRITSLTGDDAGSVWGGTEGSGYFLIVERDYLNSLSIELDVTTPFIQAVAVDAAGSLWLGTVSGVFRSDQNMWGRDFRGPATIPINEISVLLADSNGQLWIGTRGAGVRLKNGEDNLDGEQVFDTQDGLPSQYITDLALDGDGRVWAGSWSGVAWIEPNGNVWQQPFPPEELPSGFVTAILAQEQQLWIGTDNGLAFFDIATGDLAPVQALAGQDVQALAMDSLRRLWVATEGGGIFMADAEGEWVQFRADGNGTEQSILGDNVVTLAPDPNVPGAMWAGVHQQGLNYYDGQVWHDLTASARLPSKVFYEFYTDPQDASLWIGSEGGVTHFDGLSWETLIIESVLPAASIFAVTRMDEGTYWFGGRDGLTFYRPDRTAPWIRIEPVSSTVEQISDTIWQVKADENVVLSYVAGDLYTPQAELVILYRITSPGQIGAWQVLDLPFLELPGFGKEGTYKVEMQARDFAFNYSEPNSIALDVVPPPAQVKLPFLAPIRTDYFIALLVTGLVALIGFGYMSVEIIQSRRRTREAVTRSYNPFISGEPVRRQDMFFGRHDLLQRIVDTLHNNSIMIHGERRIGKTTLLYQLASHLREVDDPEYWFLPLYVDLEGTEEDVFFHFLMEEILQTVQSLPDLSEEVKASLQDLLYYKLATEKSATESYSDREFSRDLRTTIRALQTYGEIHHPGKHLRLILMMDEMDVMSEYDRLVQQRLRRIFMRDFAATLGAVVAGIRISKDWDRIESPWYNLFNEIELKPFNRDQALELLTEPVEDFYRYDPAALEFIIEYSDGRPYRIQQYALEAIGHMLADGRRLITLEDVEIAHLHIQQMGDNTSTGMEEAMRRREGAATESGADTSAPPFLVGVSVSGDEPDESEPLPAAEATASTPAEEDDRLAENTA